MGINNRQRRAAKRRKRPSGGRGSQGPAPGGSSGWPPHWAAPEDDGVRARAVLVEAIHAVQADPAAAPALAGALLGQDSPLPTRAVAEALAAILGELVRNAVGGGWSPADLGQVVRRRSDGRHLPALAALLTAEAHRHPAERVAPAWREELADLPSPAPADPRTVVGLAVGLALAGLLDVLPAVAPTMPPPGAAGPTATARGADARVLARVRALLAKAESTEFADEAEALSAKAQELVSRYALDQLADHAQDHDGEPVTARRLWIDPPYVLPKALLLDAVAEANRCRSVVAEALGFATVLGAERDLDAVELLTTSLLVQADAVMLRHGRLVGRRGTSRTRSFRRAFLVSFATRIGERLREATAAATTHTGRSAELVPLVRRHTERVEAERDRMFPHTDARATTISNREGWAAGRAAADLALFERDPALAQASG
jgi:hypothetical protein